MNNTFKWSGGAVLAIIGAIVVACVLVLRWLGQNAAAIGAGVRVAGQVFIVLLLAGGGAAAVWHVQRRRQARDDQAAPVHETAQQPVPLAPAQVPLALPPARPQIIFQGLSVDEAVEVIRQTSPGEAGGEITEEREP